LAYEHFWGKAHISSQKRDDSAEIKMIKRDTSPLGLMMLNAHGPRTGRIIIILPLATDEYSIGIT
jgi:hypothetical protein